MYCKIDVVETKEGAFADTSGTHGSPLKGKQWASDTAFDCHNLSINTPSSRVNIISSAIVRAATK